MTRWEDLDDDERRVLLGLSCHGSYTAASDRLVGMGAIDNDGQLTADGHSLLADARRRGFRLDEMRNWRVFAAALVDRSVRLRGEV